MQNMAQDSGEVRLKTHEENDSIWHAQDKCMVASFLKVESSLVSEGGIRIHEIFKPYALKSKLGLGKLPKSPLWSYGDSY